MQLLRSSFAAREVKKPGSPVRSIFTRNESDRQISARINNRNNNREGGAKNKSHANVLFRTMGNARGIWFVYVEVQVVARFSYGYVLGTTFPWAATSYLSSILFAKVEEKVNSPTREASDTLNGYKKEGPYPKTTKNAHQTMTANERTAHAAWASKTPSTQGRHWREYSHFYTEIRCTEHKNKTAAMACTPKAHEPTTKHKYNVLSP